MPYPSGKKRAFMYAMKPGIAKRWKKDGASCVKAATRRAKKKDTKS